MRCNRCLLPDDIRELGPRAVARWKREQVATGNKALKPHGQNAAKRKRNKHGRRGVDRICTQEVQNPISRYRRLSLEKRDAG